LTLYDAQLRPLATSTGAAAASLSHMGEAGQVYFLSISGSGMLNVQFANEAASAAALAQAIDAVLADDWA
jgi:hypothetical protein